MRQTFCQKILILDDKVYEWSLSAKDPHMQMTPLHFSIKCQNHLSSLIMLICGADIEAKDLRGYTALHIAAKEGIEEHCVSLLDHGADPNAFGNGNKFNKTPLHRARTQRIVQILLSYNADPSARMVDCLWAPESEMKPDSKYSVIDVYLRRNPQFIEEIFLNGITTNGEDLDFF